jgi:hypothetical protein
MTTLCQPTFEVTLDFIRNDAHKGVLDKGGVPYWQHPLRVATNVSILFPEVAEDEDVLNAALLHDVVEDTQYEYADLVSMGYNRRTTTICYWLDKNYIYYDGLTYLEKIQFLADHGPIEALKVKYADITDNSDPKRPWAESGNQPEEQKTRYDKALRILEAALDERDLEASKEAYAEALK